MTGSIHVRRARPKDVPAIAAIERDSFQDPWDQEILSEALSYFPTTFLVAAVGERIVGFIAGGLEDTGEQVYGHIANIAVAPQFRGGGTGRVLLAREEQAFAFESASGVQLEVRVSNLSAQEFYRRNGYRDVFIIPGYYANGEDAIVMMKWFRF
ncbi:MAG: ribosomal protein S18-alanine N-acetyltransferase [Methanoregulaceae archaeon]|nr:ribosomal protein S18-alanine N-acetyltransferase [Methanoregulaceae archaeon]